MNVASVKMLPMTNANFQLGCNEKLEIGAGNTGNIKNLCPSASLLLCVKNSLQVSAVKRTYNRNKMIEADS